MAFETKVMALYEFAELSFNRTAAFTFADHLLLLGFYEGKQELIGPDKGVRLERGQILQ